MTSRIARVLLLTALAVGSSVLAAPSAGAASETYTIQVDATPPTGQPLAYLHFFPGTAIKVHQGDVLDFAWKATDTPHTATLVGDADPDNWRNTNQGQTGDYSLFVPDSVAGGDDQQLDLNPKVQNPSDPTCGTTTNPCSFDASKVVSSGFLAPIPGQPEPSFAVTVNAPVGSYSFLCLLHPGMQVGLDVVATSTAVPTPDDVAAAAAKEVKHATKVDGAAAVHQSQTVHVGHTAAGDVVKVSAGGFSNNVSANEYPSTPIVAHVGDRIRFAGTGEIHTATFPKKSVATVPFFVTQCEQTGPDKPATSPTDCADPADFQIVFPAKAGAPTKKLGLSNPTAFRNSGVFAAPVKVTFIAKKPGRYTFICLVHGPQMSGVVRIKA